MWLLGAGRMERTALHRPGIACSVRPIAHAPGLLTVWRGTPCMRSWIPGGGAPVATKKGHWLPWDIYCQLKLSFLLRTNADVKAKGIYL